MTILVLSRRTSEEIVIDSNIVVRVLRIDANRVSLGITAPREIPIWRQDMLPDGHPGKEGSSSHGERGGDLSALPEAKGAGRKGSL